MAAVDLARVPRLDDVNCCGCSGMSDDTLLSKVLHIEDAKDATILASRSSELVENARTEPS